MELLKYVYFYAQKPIIKAGNDKFQDLMNAPRTMSRLFACFWCQSFGDVSPYVCSYYFNLVWVAEWPIFVKELLA